MTRVAFATLCSIVLLGCGGLTIDSYWLDRDIAIDGDDKDWQGLKWYVEDWPVDIGVANDADFLYLNLSTADRSLQRQAIMLGFEVWIDPGGGKGRILGLRYPLGMAAANRGREPRTDQERALMEDRFRRNWDRNEEFERLGDPEQLQRAFDRLLTSQRPMLLGKGSQEIRSLNMSGEEDVRVAIAFAEGRLVYEARLPLDGQYPLPQLPSNKGNKIGIGFRTKEADRMLMPGFGGRGYRGGRGGFGGIGSSGGRRSRYGSRRPRGFPRPELEPMQKWTKVALAGSPAE